MNNNSAAGQDPAQKPICTTKQEIENLKVKIQRLENAIKARKRFLDQFRQGVVSPN